MTQEHPVETEIRWRRIIEQISGELKDLTSADRLWLEEKLGEVAELKGRLHELFAGGDGKEHCAACQGACCGSGRNHMTLVEMLALLMGQDPLPQPDFRKPCPFLGTGGCVVGPRSRPFNCVTFVCERIESGFTEEQRRSFGSLEEKLRRCYAEFECRFAGASLRGLLIRSATLDGHRFLGPPVRRRNSQRAPSPGDAVFRSSHP